MNKRMIPWGVTGAALVGVVSLLAIGGTGSRHAHPDPRMDEPDLALTVMPASLAGSSSRVIRAYRIAQQIPHTLDALHCHCECKENFGHRSLLTCFQSRHGAACDICMGEAELAAQMTQRGEDVNAIRDAIDAMYSRET